MSEPLLRRFTYLERVVHWVVGGTFVALLLTGLAFAYPSFFWLTTLVCRAMNTSVAIPPGGWCLRRSLLIGQLHPHNRGGNEESHPPVHLSNEPDRWDGVRYLRV